MKVGNFFLGAKNHHKSSSCQRIKAFHRKSYKIISHDLKHIVSSNESNRQINDINNIKLAPLGRLCWSMKSRVAHITHDFSQMFFWIGNAMKRVGTKFHGYIRKQIFLTMHQELETGTKILEKGANPSIRGVMSATRNRFEYIYLFWWINVNRIL